MVNVAENPSTDLEMYCNKAGFTPKIGYWCDQFYELIEAIRDGDFIGLVAERILKGYNLTGITVIEVTSPNCFSNLRLYKLKDAPESKMVRMVRESILEYFKQDDIEIVDSRANEPTVL